MEVKSRHHLRSDEIGRIESVVAEQLGVTLTGEQYERVEFDDGIDVVLVDGEPLIAYFETERDRSESISEDEESEPFLTVRGANEYPPAHHVVTVDSGAVSFVSDGADVMRPGITEADESIEAGDLVVIVEERHNKALAIGRSAVTGTEMLGDSGKVIDSIHFVGDELFDLTI